MTLNAISSPGLVRGAGTAYELKLRLPTDLAEEVEAWARQRLLPDPNGQAGRYRTTTLYCDTPLLDVYRRTTGYRNNKYRLRRYGNAPLVYLEKKTRSGDRVSKRRDAVPVEELAHLGGEDAVADWVGDWFLRRVRIRGLSPTCRIAYTRTAFVAGTATEPLRLTLDRDLEGVPAKTWDLGPVETGKPLLPGAAVLEMKYRDAMPGLFLDLLATLPPNLGRVSKYRLCVGAWGLAGEESVCLPG